MKTEETPEQREARLKRVRERKKANYDDRKSRQVCVDCEAALEPDDGLRCAPCEEANEDTVKLYRASAKGLRAYRRTNTKKRKRLRKLKCCYVCATPREKWPSREAVGLLPIKGNHKPSTKVCPKCSKKRGEYNGKWRKRKKAALAQGIVSLRAVRDEKRRQLIRELKGLTYKPLDERDASKRYQILKGLERFGDDFTSSADLLDALDVPEGDFRRTVRDEPDEATHERQAYATTLSRLVKDGLVERQKTAFHRKRKSSYEYRLADRGRAQLKELRAS